METPFTVAGLANHGLAVRSAGFFRGAVLLVDGAPAQGRRGRYQVTDAQGGSVEIRLKPRALGLDPIPKVEVGGQEVALAEPLAGYEYAWSALPAILVLVGGALGGACGFAGAFVNVRIFRSAQSTAVKFLLTALVSIAAAAVYLALAVAVHLLIYGSEAP